MKTHAGRMSYRAYQQNCSMAITSKDTSIRACCHMIDSFSPMNRTYLTGNRCLALGCQSNVRSCKFYLRARPSKLTREHIWRFHRGVVTVWSQFTSSTVSYPSRSATFKCTILTEINGTSFLRNWRFRSKMLKAF